jgi:hypothetical protein
MLITKIRRSQKSIFGAFVIIAALLMPLSPAAAAPGICSAALNEELAIETSQIHNQKLFAEIEQLSDRGRIPERLYREYSVNDIGRAIVSRIKNQEKKHLSTLEKKDVPFDLNNETDIILFFPSENFSSIQEQGFLNQHLTNTSRGVLNKYKRMSVEDSYTGVSLGINQNALRLRPKSAFLNIRTKVDLHEKRIDPSMYYGNIGAVLKQEVRDRATWTSGDSLNIYHYGQVYYHDFLTGLTFRGSFDRPGLPDESLDSCYYEAQIYGDINFEDVDYFLVTDKNLASILKPTGKPVYLLQSVYRNQRFVFTKGKMLSTGKTAGFKKAG